MVTSGEMEEYAISPIASTINLDDDDDDDYDDVEVSGARNSDNGSDDGTAAVQLICLTCGTVIHSLEALRHHTENNNACSKFSFEPSLEISVEHNCQRHIKRQAHLPNGGTISEASPVFSVQSEKDEDFYSSEMHLDSSPTNTDHENELSQRSTSSELGIGRFFPAQSKPINEKDSTPGWDISDDEDREGEDLEDEDYDGEDENERLYKCDICTNAVYFTGSRSHRDHMLIFHEEEYVDLLLEEAIENSESQTELPSTLTSPDVHSSYMEEDFDAFAIHPNSVLVNTDEDSEPPQPPTSAGLGIGRMLTRKSSSRINIEEDIDLEGVGVNDSGHRVYDRGGQDISIEHNRIKRQKQLQNESTFSKVDSTGCARSEMDEDFDSSEMHLDSTPTNTDDENELSQPSTSPEFAILRLLTAQSKSAANNEKESTHGWDIFDDEDREEEDLEDEDHDEEDENERLYKCDICTKAVYFTGSRSHRDHMLIFHEDEYVDLLLEEAIENSKSQRKLPSTLTSTEVYSSYMEEDFIPVAIHPDSVSVNTEQEKERPQPSTSTSAELGTGRVFERKSSSRTTVEEHGDVEGVGVSDSGHQGDDGGSKVLQQLICVVCESTVPATQLRHHITEIHHIRSNFGLKMLETQSVELTLSCDLP